MTLLMAGLTIQCQQNEQDAIALKMIEGMQGALHLNRLTQQQLATSANPQMTDSLMLQINESKSLFTRLVDEYIENLGQVYEKKSGLFGGYRTSYYIASKTDQSLAITPNQYTALVQTLQDAAQQSDWGKTIKIMFPVTSHENSGMLEKDLSLNEIIAALKQVPLPTNYYSTAAYAGQIALGAAAIAGSAYLLYNNMEALKSSISDIEGYFSNSTIPSVTGSTTISAPVVKATPAITPMTPISAQKPVVKAAVETPVIEATHAIQAEPSFFENIGSGLYRGLLGNEDATVANWQAGGFADDYGAPGLTGQEMLGAVAGAGAFAAGAAKMASSNAAKYETPTNFKSIPIEKNLAQAEAEKHAEVQQYIKTQEAIKAAQAAELAQHEINLARAKAAEKAQAAYQAAKAERLANMSPVEKNIAAAKAASDINKAAEVQQHIKMQEAIQAAQVAQQKSKFASKAALTAGAASTGIAYGIYENNK